MHQMKLIALSLTALIGCAASEPEDLAEELVETEESAMMEQNSLLPNGIIPNGIIPNGIIPNGIIPNALQPDALSPSAMASLQDPGAAGVLSRAFIRYAVGCAFTPEQSLTITWTDMFGTTRTATYQGSMGLAPEWADGPLTLSGQRWVSACIAARTNFFGIPVLLSMRGNNARLGVDDAERSAFTNMEGAFWGNLFESTPHVHACYNATNVAYSRWRNRVCAAGYPYNGTTLFCGPLRSEGSCSSCTPAASAHMGFTQCGGSTEVITSFLD